MEFTYTMNTDKIHPFYTLCNDLDINHKLIKPTTPRHNGKVEVLIITINKCFTTIFLLFFC